MTVTDRDSLAGGTGLVTRGTNGAGAAVVARLRELGSDVVVTARNLPHDMVEPDGLIAADTAPVSGAGVVVEELTARGDVYIIVHVVGGSHAPAGGFAALTDHDWGAELNLNLPGAVSEHPRDVEDDGHAALTGDPREGCLQLLQTGRARLHVRLGEHHDLG